MRRKKSADLNITSQICERFCQVSRWNGYKTVTWTHFVQVSREWWDKFKNKKSVFYYCHAGNYSHVLGIRKMATLKGEKSDCKFVDNVDNMYDNMLRGFLVNISVTCHSISVITPVNWMNVVICQKHRVEWRRMPRKTLIECPFDHLFCIMHHKTRNFDTLWMVNNNFPEYSLSQLFFTQ